VPWFIHPKDGTPILTAAVSGWKPGAEPDMVFPMTLQITIWEARSDQRNLLSDPLHFVAIFLVASRHLSSLSFNARMIALSPSVNAICEPPSFFRARHHSWRVRRQSRLRKPACACDWPGPELLHPRCMAQGIGNVVNPRTTRRDMQLGMMATSGRKNHVIAGNTMWNPAY